MRLGLEIAGFKKWETYEEHTNEARFRGWYGPSAKLCAKIWLGLQSSTLDECRIANNENPVHLLLALRFLRAYPSEKELAGTFGMSEKSVRKWSAAYTRKLQLLLPGTVSLPDVHHDLPHVACSAALLSHIQFLHVKNSTASSWCPAGTSRRMWV